MKFFITETMAEYLDLLTSCTMYERSALAKNEVGKRLLMHEFHAIKDFNRRILMFRLTYQKAA